MVCLWSRSRQALVEASAVSGQGLRVRPWRFEKEASERPSLDLDQTLAQFEGGSGIGPLWFWQRISHLSLKKGKGGVPRSLPRPWPGPGPDRGDVWWRPSLDLDQVLSRIEFEYVGGSLCHC